MDAGDLIELLDEALSPELVSWLSGKLWDALCWVFGRRGR